MAGQPNRRPKRVPSPEPGVRMTNGVPRNYEIDAFWGPVDDLTVANDRLCRYKALVAKQRADRAELKIAMKLKTEEAYQEGLLSVAPTLLEIDKRVAEITRALLEGDMGEDQLKLLKTLLPELSKQRDRLYGKTRQRVTSTSVSASVDINELMRQGREQGALSAGDELVVDAEMVDEPGEGNDAG